MKAAGKIPAHPDLLIFAPTSTIVCLHSADLTLWDCARRFHPEVACVLVFFEDTLCGGRFFRETKTGTVRGSAPLPISPACRHPPWSSWAQRFLRPEAPIPPTRKSEPGNGGSSKIRGYPRKWLGSFWFPFKTRDQGVAFKEIRFMLL